MWEAKKKKGMKWGKYWQLSYKTGFFNIYGHQHTACDVRYGMLKIIS